MIGLKSKIIPLTQCEYVSNPQSGGVYTGIYINSYNTVEMKLSNFQSTEIYAPLFNIEQVLRFGICRHKTGKLYAWNGLENNFEGVTISSVDLSKEHVINLGKSGLTIDGVLYAYNIDGSFEYTKTAELGIFCRTTSFERSNFNFFYLKVWDKDMNLIHNLVPVQVGKDGGIYDTLTGKLLTTHEGYALVAHNIQGGGNP